MLPTWRSEFKVFDRSIRHFYMILSRFFSSIFFFFCLCCVKAFKIHKEICLCSIENAVNRSNRFFIFFFHWIQLGRDRIEFPMRQQRERDRVVHNEMFECFLRQFFSTFICVELLLLSQQREICILNYYDCEEKIKQIFGLKFWLENKKMEWPQTSALSVTTRTFIHRRNVCVICFWARNMLIVRWIDDFKQIEHTFRHTKHRRPAIVVTMVPKTNTRGRERAKELGTK